MTSIDGTVEVASFWMARTELTWDAFDVLVFRLDLPEEQRVRDVDGVTRPTKPYILVDRGFGHAGYPALSMSQKGAESFCAWLSEASGRRFRLPTVDEWEYAARAGSPTIYGCGDEAALAEHAWFRDNANRKTQPVATRTPNAFGLFDLHGNVEEWCLDRWQRDYRQAGAKDPLGPPQGTGRVLRGGSYQSGKRRLLCANRGYGDERVRLDTSGFRVARMHRL